MIEPADPATRNAFRAFGVGETPQRAADASTATGGEVILGLTRLSELTEVDTLADKLAGPLVEHFDDVAVVRDAVLMAISELCQNAVEHGANPAGCHVAASRNEGGGLTRMLLGIGDLGVGIPEHIRRIYPEYTVDEHAIGQALEEGISGTQRGDRGYGFSWVLRETLSSAATAAQMLVRAGEGTFRREIHDGAVKDHGWRTAPTRGTWLGMEWTTVASREGG